MTTDAGLLLTLCELLDAENDALERSDVGATARLLGEKNRLLRELDTRRAAGEAGADLVPPELRARVSDAIRRNRTLLERALLVQRRMIGMIVAAARVSAPSTGYRARGERAPAPSAAMALMRRA